MSLKSEFYYHSVVKSLLLLEDFFVKLFLTILLILLNKTYFPMF